MNAKMKTLAFIAALATFAFLCINPLQAASFSADDEEFLNKLEHDSFSYFLKEINPQNGMIKDSSRPGSPCNVAAVGFGLTALCIGESKGWISRTEAHDTILKILQTFRYGAEQEHGFFYRFLNIETGDRFMDSEASSLDTAIFLAGALYSAEYFKGTDIEKFAREIYERVDWQWMMNGNNVMCKGWVPEGGFLPKYWDSYSEAMILYALAIGSPTHPISKDAWFAWKRPVDSYKGYEVVYADSGSLYTYYYSHAWIDFKRLFDPSTKAQDRPRASEASRGADGNINYYDNSVNAVKANRQFSIDNADRYKTYGEDTWGLTACIGPDGYRDYGAKPGRAFNDGTIAPSGMAASIVFDSEEAVKGLKAIYEKYRRFLYGRYGFKDAFNMDQEWWSEEYLGVDVGITLLMIENYRTGMIWRKFMESGPIQKWVASCLSGRQA